MLTYSITYDLGNPGRNYDGVVSVIKNLANGYCRPTESHWFINSALNIDEIGNQIANEMDAGDKLMINDVGDDWRSWGLKASTNDWLKKYWRSACKV